MPKVSLLSLALLLALAVPAAHAGDTVVYNDTGLSVNSAAPTGLASTPGALTSPIGSVWNSNTAVLSGNQVTVSFASATNPDYVFGAYSDTQNILDNTVEMYSGTITRHIYGGYSKFSGVVSNNQASMSGTARAFSIHGGYSEDDNVIGNRASVSGAAQVEFVHGGYSYSGLVYDNHAAISGGTVDYDVHGGYATGNQANNNTVSVSGTAVVHRDVRGGHSEYNNATGNSVVMSGGTVEGGVYGGSSASYLSYAASRNTVTINSGTVEGGVYGGSSRSGEVEGNAVTVNGGTVEGDVYGGSSQNGEVKGNQLIMNGGAVGSHVYGGRSEKGAVTGNTVGISGTVGGNAYGGYSTDGVSANNQVTVGNTVGGAVIGGYSRNDNANDNTVTINSGTVGSVIGGWSVNGTAATGNTVNIYDGGFAQEAYLLGGSAGGDAFSNNTLNLHTAVSVARLGTFEYYNFYLPAGIKNKDAMITVTGYSPAYIAANPGLSNSDTHIGDSRLSVNIGAQAPVLNNGDIVHLIKVETPGHSLTGTPAGFSVHQGLTMLYDVETLQTAEACSLYIRVVETVVNPQTEAFSEGYAAGAAFVRQGADLLAGQGIRVMCEAAEADKGWTVFGAMEGGKSNYTTGSSVDVKGVSVVAGVVANNSFGVGNLFLGAFVEGGFGDYNSHNSFTDAASAEGKGDTSYVGTGIMGRFGCNRGLYSEASLRVGHTETDFSANDISGSYASYDSSGMYWGGHLGLGYVFGLTDAASLDVYARYLFTWLKGDTVILNSGEEVEFDNVRSQRGRVGARFSYATPQVTPYVGAAFDYEFDGDISAHTHGFDIAEPSLSGGTGVFEMGFNWRPVEGGAWSFDLGLEGYVGTREGISGGFRINYEF